MALGRMKLRPSEFFEYRLSHFFQALSGYMEEREEDMRWRLEVVRRMTTELVNIQLPQEDKVKAEDLWPLIWDEARPVSDPREMTYEEIEQHNKKLLDALDNFKNGRSRK